MKYFPFTFAEKAVADYANISLLDVEELSIDYYLLYLRDSHIYKMNQQEKGRAYLEKCWILEQTEPDILSLREQFGGD